MSRNREGHMKQWLFGTLFVAVLAIPVSAQQPTTEAQLRALVPYSEMKLAIPGLTLDQYNRAIREVARQPVVPRVPTLPTPAPKTDYLGRLSVNPYLPDSTSNQFGRYGSPYSNGITNPYSRYGSPYSPNGIANPYATQTPRLYGQDGTYLGKLSTNPYDPDSVSNPFGRFGSPFSPNSINNPFGRFGSEFSPYSPLNPYATQPPVVVGRPR
jgi:hypothetical protein